MSSRRLSAIVLLVACGGDAARTTMDGPPTADANAVVDASSADAIGSTPDANSDLVEVIAYSHVGDGLPDPSAVAVFMDPAGVTLSHGTVDAQGRAAYPLPNGGSVTVLQVRLDPMNPFVRGASLSTIRDVAPGDHLRVGRSKDPSLRDTASATTTMRVGYTPPGTVNGPYMFAACAAGPGTANPRTLTFYASCATPTFDLLAWGDNNSGDAQYVLVPDIVHTPGGNITVADAWQPMPRNSTTLSNVPTNLSRVVVGANVVLDGQPMELDVGRIDLPNAGTHMLSLRHVPSSTLFSAFTVQGIALLDRHIVVSDTPSAVTIDFDALPLPRAQSARQTPTGGTWTVSGSGTPDARVVTWWSEWTDGNNVQHYVAWELLEPGDAPAGLQLPSLPSSLSEDDPTFADPSRVDVRYSGFSVSNLDYDNLLDYSEARPHGPELRFVETMFATTPHRVHQRLSSN